MTRYLLILLYLIITTLPVFPTQEDPFEEFSISTPDQIAALSSDPDFLIGGVIREFSDYDDCHNLIQTILDDGTSPEKTDLTEVTQRTITRITLRQQPFLHMPEWIEEKYLEEGSEKLLKRTHLKYDTQGNVSQEEIYDANWSLD